METKVGAMNINQLMAEADELIRHFNSESVNDMKEVHRLEFEKHAHDFKKIQSGIQAIPQEKGTSDLSSSAEGMHEAVLDILKAFQDLKKKIF